MQNATSGRKQVRLARLGTQSPIYYEILTHLILLVRMSTEHPLGSSYTFSLGKFGPMVAGGNPGKQPL